MFQESYRPVNLHVDTGFDLKKILFKQILIVNFKPLLFNMLAIKINKKIYETTQLS